MYVQEMGVGEVVLPPAVVDEGDTLVTAGMHGEEEGPGVPLVQSLTDSPEDGVIGKVLSPEAVALGERQIDVNLSFVLTHPAVYRRLQQLIGWPIHEVEIAPDIIDACRKARDVIDLHGIPATVPDVDEWALIGNIAAERTLGIVALAGYRRLMISSSGVRAHNTSSATFDIKPGGERDDVGFWRQVLRSVRAGDHDIPPLDYFQLYRFANITPYERRDRGLIGRAIAPMEVMHGVGDLFDTSKPVRALAGCSQGYSGPLEVVVETCPDEITVKDGLLHTPPLRTSPMI